MAASTWGKGMNRTLLVCAGLFALLAAIIAVLNRDIAALVTTPEGFQATGSAIVCLVGARLLR